ncbi:MAG: NUDIX hydrolase [Bacteroidota bacterium]
MENPKNPWTVKSQKPIYDNPWVTVDEFDVINPSGGLGIYGRVHFKNLALGVIPVDEDQNTWLVGQYRFPLDEYSWEIPMGGGPIGIDKIESAKRELKEETGLIASQWTELLRIHTSNSVTDEEGFVFLAEGLTQSTTEFEETEQLEIRKLPLTEAVKMAEEGEITDSLSLAGLFKVARLFKI